LTKDVSIAMVKEILELWDARYKNCNNTKRIQDAIQLSITLNTNGGKEPEGTVGSLRKYLQYCRLPDKISCDISRDILNVSRQFKIIFLLYDVSRNTQSRPAAPRLAIIIHFANVLLIDYDWKYRGEWNCAPLLWLCFRPVLMQCGDNCAIRKSGFGRVPQHASSQ
jgi:hypothetical protein